MMTFQKFSVANRARCEGQDGFAHELGSWSLSDWFTATMGELGEAANVAKKLARVRDGIPGNTSSEEELRADLADEIADTLIYLDLLAQSQGIDLARAVVAKFNKTSRKIGFPAVLSFQTGDLDRFDFGPTS
jgi:NTP pyrophosphatase (non-canonical NTP hydrolase)